MIIENNREVEVILSCFIYAGLISALFVLIFTDYNQVTRVGSVLANENILGMKQLKVMTENEYDLICTNYYYINENGDILDKSVEIFSSKTISILLKYRNIIHHPTVMIKRQSFEKLNGYRNFKCAQDYDLWLRMRENDYKLFMMRDKLVYYRIRRESTTIKNRYLQDCTLEYIRRLHNLGNNNISEYDYNLYLEYLKSKEVDNQYVNINYKTYSELYKIAKDNLKNFHICLGMKQLLQVYLKSKYYRPRLFASIKFHLLKLILKKLFPYQENEGFNK